MATVRYWSGTWVGVHPDGYLAPGETQDLMMWGFQLSDSINVTATPIGPSNAGVLSIEPIPTLAVENIQVESDDTGHRCYFSVRNTGNTFITAYSINFAFIGS